MHTTHGAGADGMRETVLDEYRRQPGSSELLRAERTGKKPAIISRWLKLNQPYILKSRSSKQHVPLNQRPVLSRTFVTN
jgi:hypothetical protein